MNPSISDILDNAGIPQDADAASRPRFPLLDNTIAVTCNRLFHLIPKDPDDPRLRIAYTYNSIAARVRFSSENFENAQLATYLSDKPSYRNRYAAPVSEENYLHICRAMQNVAAYPWLQESSASLGRDLPKDIQLQFVRTDRIQGRADSSGITACPEALYQIRLFRGRQYVGRTGFNIHREDKGRKIVYSITNLQGIPQGAEAYCEIERLLNEMPFNYLVRQVVSMAHRTSGNVDVRGLKNPRNGDSAQLYNTVFKHEGIKRKSFKRGFLF